MTTDRLLNIAVYVAIGVAILLAGALGAEIGEGTLPGFQDGQTFAGVRGQIGDLIALLATSGGIWLAANRPRQGSEGIAAEVKDLQASGVHRADMTVVTKEDAALLSEEAARIREFKQRLDENRREGSRG